MSEWAPKRFWKEADVRPEGESWTVTLDGRGIKTPAKAALAVPTEALARAIAEEWQAQDEKIDPGTMPFTRMANSALDKVLPQRAAVAEMLAAYGDSDLLCYRAEAPDELVARQAAHWDPLLVWTHEMFGARLAPRVGVMHAAQDAAALDRLAREVHAQPPFALAAFHDLVAISGSLVLALAVIHGARSPAEAWDLSRLDESWQEEQWGVDEEAAEVAGLKRAEFLHAAHFHALSTA
ncbi:ATP12 family chaperone protein [Ponticoccus alexandrii]|uniref:ATPase n=1 Tax=Ponticoccus alexandrii TaxID=1943633 RepID=A0ABX7FBF9_9RHOB|nr:ATP12 family protein [Ponticoccus alexandrii]ETA51227.1 ATPase [Rhodobacteraceae bacterium PD-2]QRF67819.1 ATPase [Ponticoccus alexandrii]